jgi:predicted dinucleotide-binding enzyme
VVILAVPYTAAAETIREAGSLSGKNLIDISNPITPDYKALTVGHTTSRPRKSRSSLRRLRS